MKNTLFLTMLAAALMSGQVFAETAVYSVDKDWNDVEPVYISDTEATVLVDTQKNLVILQAPLSNCLTLDYQGDFVLTATMFIQLPVSGVLNITSTVDAVKTKWEDAFSVAEGGSITLCHAEMWVEEPTSGPVQFFGTDENNTVKLGNTEVKFMGIVDALSDLAMNQVGVVWTDNDISLVGKVQKSVPEPTTGTLSLLALAGLCIRRRK